MHEVCHLATIINMKLHLICRQGDIFHPRAFTQCKAAGPAVWNLEEGGCTWRHARCLVSPSITTCVHNLVPTLRPGADPSCSADSVPRSSTMAISHDHYQAVEHFKAVKQSAVSQECQMSGALKAVGHSSWGAECMKDTLPDDLLAAVFQATLDRTGINPAVRSSIVQSVWPTVTRGPVRKSVWPKSQVIPPNETIMSHMLYSVLLVPAGDWRRCDWKRAGRQLPACHPGPHCRLPVRHP